MKDWSHGESNPDLLNAIQPSSNAPAQTPQVPRIDASDADNSLQTIVLRTDRPTHAEFPSDDTAIGRLVRKFFESRLAANYGKRPSPERIYLALACLCNGNHFRATGQIVAWPSEEDLTRRTGFKRSILHQTVKLLETASLITTVNVDLGHGRMVRGYWVHECETLPPQSESKHRSRKKNVRSMAVDTRAHACGQPLSTPVDVGARACGQPLSTPVDVGARACGQPLSTPVDVGARACTDNLENDTLYTSRAPAPAPARGVETTTDELERIETTTAAQPRASAPLKDDLPSPDVVVFAARLLKENGVSPAAAADLADNHPLSRIEEVVAAMKAEKPDNPGGWIREALERNYQFPHITRDRDTAERAKRMETKRKAEEADQARHRLESLRKLPAKAVALAIEFLQRDGNAAEARAADQATPEAIMAGEFSQLHERILVEAQHAANDLACKALDDAEFEALAQRVLTDPKNAALAALYARRPQPPRQVRWIVAAVAAIVAGQEKP